MYIVPTIFMLAFILVSLSKYELYYVRVSMVSKDPTAEIDDTTMTRRKRPLSNVVPRLELLITRRNVIAVQGRCKGSGRDVNASPRLPRPDVAGPLLSGYTQR